MAEYSRMRAINGLVHGLDPKTGQWRQLYLDQSNESPDFSNAYTFNNTGVPLNEGQGWNDPIGLGKYMEKYAAPVVLGVMGGAGAAALGGAAGGAAGAAGGAAGAAGAGDAAIAGGVGDAAISGGVGADAMAGGGMDWWSELGLTAEDVGMGSSADYGAFDPGGEGLYGNSSFGSFDPGGEGLYGNSDYGSFDPGSLGGLDVAGDATLPGAMSAGGAGSSLPSFMQGLNGSDLLKYGGSALKSILGKAQGGIPGIDTAAGMIPGLAAIAYAKNQGPFDTSRMTSLYDQYNPQALAGQYDMNTGLGRSAFESSNAARGLSGSTFGNDSMTNFNTSRDIGRSELISKGALGANSIAASILDAQIKERALKNDLYGRALYSIGSVFGGRR